MNRILLILSLLLASVTANTYWHDGVYEASKKKPAKGKRRDSSEHIYIHAVAHTHDDVGWLKTADQYYSGSDQADAHAEVNLVLTTVIPELLKNPARKFTYVEMKFFTMWYTYQTDEIKQQVKGLIAEGRFEFVNGGWSMHDEASPHYEDMINNMMHGHDFLKKEFDVVPRIGWHIDPFGHSNANPRLFADMGFEAWLFARLDYQDKENREANKAMNFLWRPFEKHFGDAKQIFTAVMRDHYCWIDGFWYDERFDGDDPVVVREELDTFNAPEKVQLIVDYIQEMAADYIGDHMLMPFGCDFTFANAAMNFENMDKLITYFNAHNTANMTLLYSTPGQYIDALQAQNLTWPTKYDDMFPYADNPQDFWTGYFASRQAGKKQVRDGQANLHASSQLLTKTVVQTDATDAQIEEILSAKADMLDWMGVYQHHDAVSGTAKQHVADNYVIHLAKAMAHSNEAYSQELRKVMANTTGIAATNLTTCIGAQNETVAECPVSAHANQSEFIVVVHNPAAQNFTQLVKIQLPSANYSAHVWSFESQSFVAVHADILRQQHFNDSGDLIPEDYELYLPYELEPNQVGYIRVSKGASVLSQSVNPRPVKATTKAGETASANTTLTFMESASTSSLVFELARTAAGSTEQMKQQFTFDLQYYAASQGKDHYVDSSNAPEGAYLLKPDRYRRWQTPYSRLDSSHIFEDLEYIKQWTFVFSHRLDGQFVVVKVKHCPQFSDFVEFVVELNGIPVMADGQGKDVTVNWKFSNFSANSTFWTDSNGLEMQERILNYRPSWNWSGDQNISSNYYPVNTAIAMRDVNSSRQATVLNERSQAGSADLSTKSSIEIIQNRRLLYDDWRGVGEALNETDSLGYGMKVNARYWLEIFDRSLEKSQQRQQQLLIDQPLQLFFAFDYSTSSPARSSEEQKALRSVSLGSFNEGKCLMFPLARNKLLARFENIGDKFDDPTGQFGNSTLHVDIVRFAYSYYFDANGLPDPFRDLSEPPTLAQLQSLGLGDIPLVDITEVDITNNQAWTTMEDKKAGWTWHGDDDHLRTDSQVHLDPVYIQPVGRSNSLLSGGLALEPQRIRSFVIEYRQYDAQQAFLQA